MGEKYVIIAKLDKRKLKHYSEYNKIRSSIIVLTNERKKHILEDHFDDYIQIMRGLEETIKNPNEVRVNNIDASELHYIKQLDKDNQIEIVKVNITNDKKHPENSIMTSWIINNKYLNRVNKKTTSIYKKQ